MKKLFLFSVISLSLAYGLNAQMLNVESQHIHQDSTDWVGKGNLSFNLTSNQQQVWDFNTSLHVQYKKNKNTHILLGGAGMIRAGKSNFDNSGQILLTV
ncbi:MAG TPA: hypothetical protein ENN08_02695 [Bacteroidales bacterium]|nr:hypothetical protein [Bacteroidales bacterium]